MSDEADSSESLNGGVSREDNSVEWAGEETLACPDDAEVQTSGLEADYCEERFRVDRRKLEQLLQVTESEGKNAEEFFNQVTQETNTVIVWPSKLKIGAKSKKDPLIKVCGSKDGVLLAKEKIISALDTKSLRVTLKMEVSHTEHSHVIGKGGSNVQRVMQETDCHIHFPDSNRTNLGEKSNQVSITGQCAAVETARVKIRVLLPLVVLFELPITMSTSASLDSSSTVIQQTQQKFGVSIVVKQHLQPGHVMTWTVVLRGSVSSAQSVKEAAVVLFETLTGQAGVPFTVTLLMDIASAHLPTIIGYDGSNLKKIYQRTGATIYFPDTNCTISQRSTLYITGGIQNVFLARDELMGWLPVVLMFDLKEEREIETNEVISMMEQLDVFISLKPKVRQMIKSVIVKSTERNMSNVYEARRRLLSLASQAKSTSSLTPPTSTQCSANVSPGKTNMNSSVGSSLVYHQSFPSSAFTRAHIIPPTVLTPYVQASPGFQPVIILPSVASYPQPVTVFPSLLPSSGRFMPLKVNAMTTTTTTSNRGVNQDVISPLLSSQANKTGSDATSTSETTNTSWSSGLLLKEKPDDKISSSLSETTVSSLCATKVNDTSILRTQSGLTFDSNSAAFVGGNAKRQNENTNRVDCTLVPGSESLLQLCRQKSGSFTDNQSSDQTSTRNILSSIDLPFHRSNASGESLSLFSSNRNLDPLLPLLAESVGKKGLLAETVDDKPLPLTSRRFGQLHSPSQISPTEYHDSNSSSVLGSQGINYNLAPGRGRPKKQDCSLFLNSSDLFADADYEDIKVSATRAMQQKPSGDSRKPTNCWTGFYFSKSMPDSALCDKLSQSVFRNRGVVNESGDASSRFPDDSWRSTLDSYESSPPLKPSLVNCERDPVTDSNVLASNLSDMASALARSAECSGDRGNQLTSYPHGFEDTLSQMSQIWRPMPKDSDEIQNPSDLAELFSKLGLWKYTDLFQQQEIDLSTFLTLTESDLRELGVSTFGARRKMLNAIADYNERQRRVPPPPGLLNPFRNPNLPRCHDAGSQSGRW